jgi:serine/threonine-protein kinase
LQPSPRSSADTIRRHVDRILGSRAFSGSERMSRFLRFVIDRSLDGRASELKEYTIGIEVFDRDAAFDPRIDPIVRVEARRLRTKLAQYYETDGASDTVRVLFPKGSYVPQFSVPEPPGSGSQAALPRPAPVEQDARVAVLPLGHPAGDSDAEYLADGLTQQIIHRLTRIEGLSVLGWQSSSRMRDRQDTHEAARELGASRILTGSVRTGGERLRVTAQLMNVETRTFIWSEVYDRPRRDLFAVEEEIADAIVRALTVKIPHVAACGAPASPEAWELYFRGRYQWNKRTLEGLRISLDCHKAAVAVDPECALAWAGLADSYLLMADYGLDDVGAVVEPARSAALKALQLCPGLGEAEACLAMISALYDWKWDDGERRFRRSMELSPGYATAYHWYAVDFLALRGRFATAAAALAKAMELEPLSGIIREGRGYLALMERRFEDAVREQERLIAFDNTFYKARASIGRALIQMGCHERAIAELGKASILAGMEVPTIVAALGQAQALAGNREVARQHLARLGDLANKRFVASSCFATVHIGLGEYREAVEWLRRGCDRHEMSVSAIGVHPLYDPLRTLPEFQALVEQVGCLA